MLIVNELLLTYNKKTFLIITHTPEKSRFFAIEFVKMTIFSHFVDIYGDKVGIGV